MGPPEDKERRSKDPCGPGGEMTDHDLLTRIDERVQKMDRCITNHLAHHWAITLALVGAVFAALASLAIALGTR
jgi:hypothetical protein